MTKDCMFRTLGCLLAITLLFPSSAPAEPTPATDYEAAAVELMSLLSDQEKLYAESHDVLRMVTNHIVESVNLMGTGVAPAEADRRTLNWARSTRAKIEDLRTRVAAAPIAELHYAANPLDSDEVEAEARIKLIATSYPKVTANVLAVAEAMIEPVSKLAPRAVKGDVMAGETLISLHFGAKAAALAAENAYLDVQIAARTNASPQRLLLESAKRSNGAMIELLKLAGRSRLNPKTNAAPTSQRMKTLVTESRGILRQVSDVSRTRLEEIRKQMSGEPGLFARLETGYASYDESARIELAIADVLETMAVALTKDGANPAEIYQAYGDKIGPLVERRLELYKARMRLLTN